MIKAIYKEIENRAKAYASPAPKPTANALRLLRTAGLIADTAARNAADRAYSPEGQRDRTRIELSGLKLAQRFQLAKAATARHRADIAGMRTKLESDAFKPWDNDAVASDIRAAARGMSQADVIKAASADPRVLAAIRAAPKMTHGVDPQPIAQLVDAHLSKHHSFELVKIDAHAEAVACAEAALQVATKTISEAGAFRSEKELSDWLASFAPSKADLEKEASGGAAAGHPAFSTIDSMELVNTDALQGLPA